MPFCSTESGGSWNYGVEVVLGGLLGWYTMVVSESRDNG